jgi:hypothetical protein
MDGNRQQQFCEALINDGSAFAFLEQVIEDTAKEDHLPALDRAVYLQHIKKLDLRFAYDTGTALILLHCWLENSEKVVQFEKKEVGALIRFPKGATGNAQAIAPINSLLRIPSMMALNPAQINELEFLLNKAGETLGVILPIVRPATELEQEAALRELALSALKAKPKHYYQSYLDNMKASGTPVTLTQSEFFQLAEATLGSKD